MKVLVVEDNPSNMKLVTGLLRRSGNEVFEAQEAESGLRIAREQRPNLILMDIQLPGMDGLSAVRLLRRDDETKDIKVVALTAFAMLSDQKKIIDAGCDGYMSKPIDYKKFLKMIESFDHGS